MSARDPYLQPNGVLQNKLELQDGHELLDYEKNFATTRYIDLKKQTKCPDAKRAVSRRGILFSTHFFMLCRASLLLSRLYERRHAALLFSSPLH